MPEKITKDIWWIIVIVPFLATLAKSLNGFFNKECKFDWKDFLIQLLVGTISGFLFGLLGCWITNGNVAAIGAISGFGAVVGIAGVTKIAEAMQIWLESKFK
jgi:hypothetical protein